MKQDQPDESANHLKKEMDDAISCGICPHHCVLQEGQSGLCRARRCQDGKVVSDNYGLVTAIALDPIEKKPFHHFYPGSFILSVGSFGCNMHCAYCQNSSISMVGKKDAGPLSFYTPEHLVETGLSLKSKGNIGLAFTYNEPLVGYEYVLDCAKLAAEAGLQTVLVTNGMICREPLALLLPYVQAMNVDLKSSQVDTYQYLGGDLGTVKETIVAASGVCHVEVTTLLVPGMNDNEREIRELAGWLAGVDPDIPYHVSRFFPRWNMADKDPTPVDTVYSLAGVARQYLRQVYTGNV